MELAANRRRRHLRLPTPKRAPWLRFGTASGTACKDAIIGIERKRGKAYRLHKEWQLRSTMNRPNQYERRFASRFRHQTETARISKDKSEPNLDGRGGRDGRIGIARKNKR